MKNYKIWILFILLSIFSFGAKPGTCGGEPNGNGIGVWAESIEFNTDGTLSLIIKARTGEKFGIPKKLKVEDIEITSGLDLENPSAVMATLILPVVSINPKIVTKWEAIIPIGTIDLTNKDIRLKGNADIFDVSGNQHAIDSRGLCFGPFVAPDLNGNVELKIYEKLATLDNWENVSTGKIGEEVIIDDLGTSYIFTKGGSRLREPTPSIYVVGYAGEGGGMLERIEINVNGVDKTPITGFAEKESCIKPISYLKENEKNTVVVKPVSIFGVEGSSVTLDFIVDTDINHLQLGDGIIGELNSEGIIKIDLSEIKELSGIEEYSYIFTVGNRSELENESNLDGQSFTVITGSSITSTPKWVDGKVEILISGFIPGSKGILLFTVYDKLGHKKTFEKTYFIPEQSQLNTTIEGEVKQRKSNITIVTEGNIDKFGVDSSIDGSSED